MITLKSEIVEQRLQVTLEYQCKCGIDEYYVFVRDLTFASLTNGTHISHKGERESVAEACYYSIRDGLRIGSRLGKQVAKDAINNLK